MTQRVTLLNRPPRNRFAIPLDECEVSDKRKLESYRALWDKWIRWYDLSDVEPHSIVNQIQQMVFNDLCYRSVSVARTEAHSSGSVAARAETLQYMLDTGFVATQVLAVCKLAESKHGSISVLQLVKDVRKHRHKITREVYVCGTGTPYDPSPPASVTEHHLFTAYGLQAPEASRWLYSHDLHVKFDRLSGKTASNRSRDDLISDGVFSTVESWLRVKSIERLKAVRNKFLAHPPESSASESFRYQGIQLADLDDAQRAIVRTERAITDFIMCIGEARDVVPLPPLGMFNGLTSIYTTPAAVEKMYDRWRELAVVRNSWKNGILDELAPVKRDAN